MHNCSCMCQLLYMSDSSADASWMLEADINGENYCRDILREPKTFFPLNFDTRCNISKSIFNASHENTVITCKHLKPTKRNNAENCNVSWHPTRTEKIGCPKFCKHVKHNSSCRIPVKPCVSCKNKTKQTEENGHKKHQEKKNGVS